MTVATRSKMPVRTHWVHMYTVVIVIVEHSNQPINGIYVPNIVLIFYYLLLFHIFLFNLLVNG